MNKQFNCSMSFLDTKEYIRNINLIFTMFKSHKCILFELTNIFTHER